MNTITLAISGASGVQYGFRLLECLIQANQKIHLLISTSAFKVIELETNWQIPKEISALEKYLSKYFQAKKNQLKLYSEKDWTAPIASGSAKNNAMIICPCSSGTLASIANGISDNLLERAADVMIKEQRKLILVHRETPLSIIHLENMLKLARMGVTILPASPGFYHKPKKIEGLVDFIVARILDHLGIDHQLISRWGS